MLKVTGIDHLVLRTDAVEAMLDFYTDILGCQVERRLDDIGLIQLRAGNALIDIVVLDSELGRQGGKAPQQSGRNMDHFCLQLDWVEQADLMAYLAEHEVPVLSGDIRYGATGLSWSLYIRDPQGNTVELKPIDPEPAST